MNKKNIFFKMALLLVLSVTGLQALQAQYLFHESFANTGVFSKPGWQLITVRGKTFRDTISGYQTPLPGSLRVSFNDIGAGDKDTLIFPAFSSSSTGDSIWFDHAHRAKFTNFDSMGVFYSTNLGTTMQLLHVYYGNALPDPSTLSTVAPSMIGGIFIPTSATDWATKSLSLPTGTNRIMFVFYSDNGDELFIDNVKVGKAPQSCINPPTFGGTTSTILACPGSALYLLPDSFELNPYLTYTWQRSLDDGLTDPWTNATNGFGFNSAEFYLTNFSQPYYYRLQAECGSQSFTPSKLVTFDSTYNCYNRNNLGGYCNAWITNVTLGANLNNNSFCGATTPGNEVTYYPPSANTTDTLTAGDPYASISIATDLFGPWLDARVGFWIDYNRDGAFDSIEFVMANTNASTQNSVVNFTVPANAGSGLTGLRVRAVESYTNIPMGTGVPLNGNHAHNYATSGEVEDYLVYINPSPICSSTPIAGTLRDTFYAVCAGNTLSFNVAGASFGQGITYQWQNSNDNGVMDPWTDIAGATEVNYNTPAISNITYFRLKVECSNSSATSYSSTIFVWVKPFYSCYCNNDLGGSGCNPGAAYISNVSVAGTTINNNSLCANDSYTFYDTTATTTDTVFTNQIISVQVTNTEISSAVAVWVDYNHDSVYTKEEFTLVTASSIPNVASIGWVTIPANAMLGLTGMRVRIVNAATFIDSVDACTNFRSGETEDYVIYIAQAPTCSGTPAKATYPLNHEICAGTSFNINAVNAPYGDGIVYQWQYSLDAQSWFDIAGKTSRNFEAPVTNDTTYYRLNVTCSNSSQITYGDTIKVGIKEFYRCYCSDIGGAYSCTNNEYISNVNFPSRNLNVSSNCNKVNIDHSYTYNAPIGFATDTVTAGQPFNVSVSYNYRGQYKVVAWVDHNRNSVFENNEFTLLSAHTASGQSALGNITIPVTTSAGYTGMRIRAMDASNPLDSNEACAFYLEGETEDYVIFIKAAEPCNSSITAGTIPTSMVMCANKDFMISAIGATTGIGVNYVWEKSDDNGLTDPWTTVTGSTSWITTNIPGVNTAKYFRLKATCSLTNTDVVSNSMHLTIDTFYNCYNATSNLGGGNCNNDYISNVSIDGTTLDNNSTCNNTPLGARTVFPASGNTTATLVGGVTYTINVTPSNLKSMGVWVDYNKNGTYEVSEFTLIEQRSDRTSSIQFTVPSTVTPGLTGLRVRTNEALAFGFPVGGIYSHQAANNFIQGETEDYVIMLDTLKPATGVMVTDITDSSVRVSWTNGNGSGRIVVAKRDTTVMVLPTNSTRYTPDPIFASGFGDSTGVGNYVLFSGDRDNYVDVFGLDSLKDYDFYVYEYIETHLRYFIPVSLLSFDAKVSGDDVKLNWLTASEKNNRGFELQKSTDGKLFVTIANIKGNGNTAQQSNYSYLDDDAFNQSNKAYYRLKQIDFNNHFTYSNQVVASKQTDLNLVTVNPNPFSNELNISLPANTNEEVDINITDVLGNSVLTQKTTSKDGNLRLNNLENMPAGVYFITIRINQTTKTFKVVH
jgi:hypothetical protein